MNSSPPNSRCRPQDGFHVLKDVCDRKTYFGGQSREIADDLEAAIEGTRRAAPSRTRNQSYLLGDSAHRVPTDQISTETERGLEARLLSKWTLDNDVGNSRVEDLWEALVARQVPLFDSKDKEGWGWIDLLAVDHLSFPIVVELKRADSTEPVLRAACEAIAYTIALEAIWNDFRPEWEKRLDAANMDVPEGNWNTKRLVVLAPTAYWKTVRSRGNIKENHWQDAWINYNALVTKLQASGFDLSHWSFVDAEEGDERFKLVELPERT